MQGPSPTKLNPLVQVVFNENDTTFKDNCENKSYGKVIFSCEVVKSKGFLFGNYYN